MRTAAVAAFGVYAVLPAGASCQRTQPTWPDGTAHANAIDAFTLRVFETGATPALGVAVVADGRTVYQQTFGLADAADAIAATDSTLWYVASTTKSLTGFAAALLAGREALDLNAPIARILPAARWHAEAGAGALDVMAFLTHTHGLNGNGPITLRTAFTGQFADDDELLRLLAFHDPLDSRVFTYSNLGYNVAGFVLQAVSGDDWKTVVEREVLRPAGMRDTHASFGGIARARLAQPHALTVDGAFERLPYGKTDATMHAAGGHVSTLGDLARWVTVHMNGGTIDGRRVFPADVVRNTHRLHVVQDRAFAFLHRVGWGIGWDIGTFEGDTILHRHGSYSGSRSHVSFSPARRVGVVAMANGSAGSAATDLIAAYVYDLAAGRPDADERAQRGLDAWVASIERAQVANREDRARRAARQRPLPHPLAAYAGTYENDAFGTMVWSVDGDRLRVRWGTAEGFAEVFDADANQLRIELIGGGQVVQFVFAGDEPASALRTLDQTFRRN